MTRPEPERTPVLFLHSSSDLYGSDRSLLRTIDALRADAVDPVVCLPYDGPLVEQMESRAIRTYVLDLAVLRRGTLTPLGLLVYPVRLAMALVRVWRIARRTKVTMIHTNTSAVVVGGCVSRLRGIPHLWHIREILLSPVAVRRGIAWCVRHLSTVVIGVSSSVIDNLARDQPDILGLSRVVHNGIDTAAYRSGCGARVRAELGAHEHEILVGMIGRVGSWKGQDLFLRSAHLVLSKRPGVRFVAIGGAFRGYEARMEDFRDEVRRLGIEDRFRVEDFRADVSDILAALDIFVLPSIQPDPFPTTVLEAMAAGKAVVANAHGGVTEMLEDGRSGLLVPPNHANAMADAIVRLIDDPVLRLEFGRAARVRVVDRFSVDRYAEEIRGLFASTRRALHADMTSAEGSEP
jgi:glycosyltransferase involved in cell wall biosynthesis